MTLGITYQREAHGAALSLDHDMLRQLRPDVVRVVAHTEAELWMRLDDLTRARVRAVLVIPVEQWHLREVERVIRRASGNGLIGAIEVGRAPCRAFETPADYLRRAAEAADLVVEICGPRVRAVLPIGGLGDTAAEREWFAELAARSADATPEALLLRTTIGGVHLSAVTDGWPSRRAVGEAVEQLRATFGRFRLSVEIGWPIGESLGAVDRARAYLLGRVSGRRTATPTALDAWLRDTWLRAAWDQWRAAGADVVYVRGFGDDRDPFTITAPTIAHAWRDLRLSATSGDAWTAGH